MTKTRLNQKIAMGIVLILCIGAAFAFGLSTQASGQEMVLAHVVNNDPSNCRLVVDKSGEEKPCPSSASSGSFIEMTEREAVARGLLYVPVSSDKDAALRRLANVVDGTRLAYLTRVGPTSTPYGEKWVVANGRFEVGETPLKPNYITETIVLTEARAKEYGFTVYVPITTTYEHAHSELMRVLGNHPTPS